MKIRNSFQAFSALVLGISTILPLLAIAPASATAQTCTWTGVAGDNKFSTAGNWTNCGGGAPGAGGIIAFNTMPATDTSLNNDLGVTLGGVVDMAVTTNNYGYYNINSMTLADGAAISLTPASVCNASIIPLHFGTLTDAGSLDIASAVKIDTQTTLAIGGNATFHTGYVPTASGSHVDGNVIIAPRSQSTTASDCGGHGAGFGPGPSITGFTIHGLTVQKGAQVALGDVSSFPLTLGGGSGTGAPEVEFATTQSNSSNVPVTYTVSSPITLLDDASFWPDAKVTVNVTGAISGSGKQLTKSQLAEGILNINPSSNSSATQTGTLRDAPQTTTITDKTTDYITVVDNQTTILDGSRESASVYTGGTLKGNGVLIDYLSVDDGGIVAPGHSPGCITAGDGSHSYDGLTLDGVYQVEIGGTTPCTGYDQLKVGGTVSLSSSTSSFTATLYNGFVPKVGQSYTIIDNDGTDAVAGTFAGIAEGGTYTNQGVTYTVTYKGGDGNDVVLTVKSIDASKLPKAPNTGMQLVMAHPIIGLAFTTVAALGMVVIARRLKPAQR